MELTDFLHADRNSEKPSYFNSFWVDEVKNVHGKRSRGSKKSNFLHADSDKVIFD